MQLRRIAGTDGPDNLILTVQDKTFDYLMTSAAKEIRVSAYLDRDWANVEESYGELFVTPDCPFRSIVTRVIPGSKTRKNIRLPAAMKEGEQLTILLEREPIEPAQS